MANKILETIKLSIDVAYDVDKDGNNKYKKKSIGNVKANSSLDKVASLADKFKDIMDEETQFSYTTSTHKIEY